MKPALQRDWTRFRLNVKSNRHSQREPDKCALCKELIEAGQAYYDGGSTGKAHRICVEVEKAKTKQLTKAISRALQAERNSR